MSELVDSFVFQSQDLVHTATLDTEAFHGEHVVDEKSFVSGLDVSKGDVCVEDIRLFTLHLFFVILIL